MTHPRPPQARWHEVHPNFSGIGRAIDAYQGPIVWQTPEGKLGMHPQFVRRLLAALDQVEGGMPEPKIEEYKRNDCSFRYL